jgi:hypothetical protein
MRDPCETLPGYRWRTFGNANRRFETASGWYPRVPILGLLLPRFFVERAVDLVSHVVVEHEQHRSL